MKIINLVELSDYPEDILLAKVDIEKKLLEKGIIEERFKINEFIEYLKLQDTIYVNGSISIPYSIHIFDDESYLFIADIAKDKNVTDLLLEKLYKINYDINNAEQVNNFDLYTQKIDIFKRDYFLVNSKIYIVD